MIAENARNAAARQGRIEIFTTIAAQAACINTVISAALLTVVMFPLSRFVRGGRSVASLGFVANLESICQESRAKVGFVKNVT